MGSSIVFQLLHKESELMLVNISMPLAKAEFFSLTDPFLISGIFFSSMFLQNAPTTRIWKTLSEEWDIIMDTTVITNATVPFRLVGTGSAEKRGLRCPLHV